MKKLRIALAGGGTGGHIIPLIAVAQELNKQSSNFGIELDMRYFGSAYDYAELLMENGIRFVPIYSSKFRRYWSALNLIDFVKFFLSLFQLFWKLFWFMPDMIFSKGGPGALAVVLAGRFYMIPTIIHESDSVPGLTNKISGRFAKKIFLSFAKAEDYFSKNKNIEVVGNPVRESLFQQAANLGQEIETAPKNAKRGFGMNPEEPLILVLGGSQGAERLNNFILENKFFIAVPEKALADSIYLTSLGRYNCDFEAISFEKIDKQKVNEIIKRTNNKTKLFWQSLCKRYKI